MKVINTSSTDYTIRSISDTYEIDHGKIVELRAITPILSGLKRLMKLYPNSLRVIFSDQEKLDFTIISSIPTKYVNIEENLIPSDANNPNAFKDVDGNYWTLKVASQEFDEDTRARILAHLEDKNNPHKVTADQIGASSGCNLEWKILD